MIKTSLPRPSSVRSENCPYFQLFNSLAAKVLLLQLQTRGISYRGKLLCCVSRLSYHLCVGVSGIARRSLFKVQVCMKALAHAGPAGWVTRPSPKPEPAQHCLHHFPLGQDTVSITSCWARSPHILMNHHSFSWFNVPHYVEPQMLSELGAPCRVQCSMNEHLEELFCHHSDLGLSPASATCQFC